MVTQFVFVGKAKPMNRMRDILFSLKVLAKAIRGYQLSIKTIGGKGLQ